MSTSSVTVGGRGRVENPVEGTEKRTDQGGRRPEGGHAGGSKTTEKRQSPPRARRLHSRVMDAAREGRQDGALEAGDTDTGEPVVSRSPSEQSDDLLSRVSGASGAGAGKGGREPRSPRLNGTYGRLRTGELYRASSTRGARPGCRVEVRGELEITNLFSANDLLRLLEDGPPSFSLQLENVELRVGPNQSARLGEAVPALQEYLRRHLERRLQEVAGSEAATRLRSFASRGSTASLGGTNGRSAKNTTNILLTGNAVGGVHPLLLASKEEVPPTAGADALPSADVSARTKGVAYQSADHILPPAAGRPAAVAVDRTDRARLSVDGATAAAVPVAAGPTITEQPTQQQRPSAEATTLEQQILEVRGRVQSLLAEEGISTVTAETAALQKKKGEEGATHDGNEPVGRVSEKGGLRGSSVDKSSEAPEPKAREPISPTTTSQFDILPVTNSSSSGSRRSTKSGSPHADSLKAESHGSVSAEKEDKAAGKDTAVDDLTHTVNEARGRVVLPAEEASRGDNAEQGAASAAVRLKEDEEDRKETVSDSVQGRKGGAKDGRQNRGTEAALSGVPGQQKLGTFLEHAGKEITAEDLMKGDAMGARPHVSRESKAPVEGVSEVELRDHAKAAEIEEEAPGAAEAKVQSGTSKKKEERENGKTLTETATADTRRAERGTAEVGAAAVAASVSEVKQRVHAEAAKQEKAPSKAEAKVQRESMKKTEEKENGKMRTETATAETRPKESGTARVGTASVAASVSEVNQRERAEAAKVEAKAPGEAEAKAQSGRLENTEERENGKTLTETATADTPRAERGTAEVGAAAVAASVSEVKQRPHAEAAKEEKAPGEAAGMVQSGGLKKIEKNANEKMQAETAAAETRRTERGTAEVGAAPVAASTSEAKQRVPAEAAKEEKAPGEAAAMVQSGGLKKTEGKVNEKMRAGTAAAETRRTERGTAEVGAAPVAAGVSDVEQPVPAEAAKEEKAPGEVAAMVQSGGLKKTEGKANEKMRAETAAAETRRTERGTAEVGAAPVAASVSDVKQRGQAEVARVQATVPGEAEEKVQSYSMKKAEVRDNEKMRTGTATAEARRTEGETAEVGAAPAAADENAHARGTKQTGEREEKTLDVAAETRGKDMEITGRAAAPSRAPQNTGEQKALLRVGSLKKTEEVQRNSAELPRRGGSAAAEISTRLGRTESGKQVVRGEAEVSVEKIGQTAREKLSPLVPQNKGKKSPTTKFQETLAKEATGVPPAQEPLLEKHERLPGETPTFLMPSKEAEKLLTSERQEDHAKEVEKVLPAQEPPSAKAESHGDSPSEGEAQGSARQSKVYVHPEEKIAETPDKDASEVQRQASAAAGIAAAPTFVQALSNFFFWGASEPESTPSDVPQEASAIGRKSSAEAVEQTDKAGGEPPQAAADMGGTSAEGRQEKKKPRPKLKPKAAPASMSKPAKQ